MVNPRRRLTSHWCLSLLTLEGFVGDVALPNVRYELEHELQQRRDAQAKETGRILAEWEIDQDEADRDGETISRQPSTGATLPTSPSRNASFDGAVQQQPQQQQQHRRRNHQRFKDAKADPPPISPK